MWVTDRRDAFRSQYFPRERDENEKFKELVRDQAGEKHYPTVEVANIVGLSSRTILKLTSKVKVVDGDRPGKINIGLSIKSEAKARKVIGYSRKTDRGWEFSRATVALIKEYQVAGAIILWPCFLTTCRCRDNSPRS